MAVRARSRRMRCWAAGFVCCSRQPEIAPGSTRPFFPPPPRTPKGVLLLIHRPERLAEMLARLEGRAGGVVIFPLWPMAGRPARRVLILARKGSRAPLTLAGGLVLHEPDGRYSAAADAVLRDG